MVKIREGWSHVADTSQRDRPALHFGLAATMSELICLLAGTGLLALAFLADKTWFDGHILPRILTTREHQAMWWMIGRAFVAGFALFLMTWLRRRVARTIREGSGRELVIQSALTAIAVLVSLCVSEYILRHSDWRKLQLWPANEEPLREADPNLGWRNKPSRTGVETFGGRRIVYHFDKDGHRIARAGLQVDYDRPTIVLAGESIMIGFRLNWPESIPGRLETITGMQSASLAVNGYSTDQMYMQLRRELPRFRQPVAVVALFAPGLLERNLRHDKPHFDQTLRWRPAKAEWRLKQLVTQNILPISRTSTVEQAIATTRAVLEAIVAEARRRNAEPVILVPSLMPEHSVERDLRLRILTGLPYILVPLDRRWRIAGDRHPDAWAGRAMAEAVATELERRRPALFNGR